MCSDFSAAGRAARDSIVVPAIPYDVIRRRSNQADFRTRAQQLIACFTLTLVVVSTATGFAQKTWMGIRIWLSNGKATVAVASFVMVRDPLPSDARRVIDSASFVPVLPMRFPPGTRLSMLMYSPADHPNTISLQYLNDRTGYHSGLTIIATSAIEQGTAPSSSALSSAAYSWRVGDETVLIPRGRTTEAEIDSLKVDLSSAQPHAIQDSLLRTVTVLGGAPPAVADATQRYARHGSVLIGSQLISEISRLVRTGRPLLDSRIVTLANIPFEKGVPDYAKATLRWSSRVAVPAEGIRAINAVLRVSAAQKKYAILFSDAGSRYDVALVAYSPPYAAVRYWVSKTTLSVHRADS